MIYLSAIILFCVGCVAAFTHARVGQGLRIGVAALLALVIGLLWLGGLSGEIAIHAAIILLGALVLAVILSIIHLAAVLSARRADKAGEP